MGFLQRLFHGRNGVDQLNIALFLASMGLNLLSRVLFQNFLSSVAYGLLFLCVFRMISRNVEKRQRENFWFQTRLQALRVRGPKKDKANFRYFKCPGCGQQMRVPKGRGNVKITCSKCGQVFYKKV